MAAGETETRVWCVQEWGERREKMGRNIAVADLTMKSL
jgi:hypothetical protein